MARRVSFRGRSRAPKRRTFWRATAFSESITETIGAAGIGEPRFINPFAGAGNSSIFEAGITLVRLRGHITVQTAITNAERVEIMLGLIVLNTDEDGAILDAQAPGPLSNDFADWIWRGQAAMPGDCIGQGGVSGNPLNYRFEIDSKAMRKESENQTLGLVAEIFAIDAITSEVFEYQGYIASLFKE